MAAADAGEMNDANDEHDEIVARARAAWRKVGLGIRFCTAAQVFHNRRLHLLASHGKATQVTKEIDSLQVLRLWQQGDKSTYDPAAIEQRIGNRFNEVCCTPRCCMLACYI